ncbi:hypothetical protein NP493_14g05011 [Ridgeia piscesae]|uniref:Uncharacterized protein n=1 Tax=Ridgeia piscesae TaxID=27915 RepID=A0AAD9PEE4_RIDPI|nr:hypothetical protein NP493_14g05011 [Ridgeia piscesae]
MSTASNRNRRTSTMRCACEPSSGHLTYDRSTLMSTARFGTTSCFGSDMTSNKKTCSTSWLPTPCTTQRLATARA